VRLYSRDTPSAALINIKFGRHPWLPLREKKLTSVSEAPSRIRRFGRILAYTASMYFVTHLIVFFYLFPIGLPLILHNPEKQRHIKKLITGALFKIIGQKLKVTGIETLEPSRNYLIISNYPGSYAGFALMNIFPEASLLVHSFLSRIPFVGLFLKLTGAIFVQSKRYGKSKQTIDAMLRHIRNRDIIILPEGGRSPDGGIHKFKHGFIYILRHSSMDLLPVTLCGFYRLKPMKRLYLDPDAGLEIFVHKPIERLRIESLNDQALLKLTTDIVKSNYTP
jgi:1-acyl-sn-glycerol-3-phosphate acyltransferase